MEKNRFNTQCGSPIYGHYNMVRLKNIGRVMRAGGSILYYILCESTKLISQPFNLEDILGEEARPYRTIRTFRKIDFEHEKIIEDYLRKYGAL